MKTTHQLAQELLALPNVPVEVELWTGDEPVVFLNAGETGKAMICMKRHNDPDPIERHGVWKFVSDNENQLQDPSQ